MNAQPPNGITRDSSTRDVLKVFWGACQGHGWKIAGILIAGGLAELSQSLFAPLAYKRFIDLLSQTQGLGARDVTYYLIWLLVTIAAIRIVGSLFTTMRFSLAIKFQIPAMSYLRVSSYETVLKQSYRFFADSFVGSIVNKINNLTNAWRDFTGVTMIDIWTTLFTVVGSLAVFFYYDAWVGAIVLVWVCLIVGGNFLFVKWLLKFDFERAAKGSIATGVMSDGLTNALNVKMFVALPEEIERFGIVDQAFRKIQAFTWYTNRTSDTLRGWLTVALEFCVMLIAIQKWQDGIFTIGTLVLFQSLVIGLHRKIADIGRVMRDIFSAISDAKEAVDILNLPNDIRDRRGAKPLVVTRGAVTFDSVDFNYNETRSILKDFSLKLAPREKVALVGSSGAGKTTVTKLLFRFYDVSGGAVLVDGQDISKVTQNSLRELISLVPQEPILFHRSLKENISYGRRDATDEQIFDAARKAHCHEFIESLQNGYDTLVGERGIKLSGGERQRVAIARAILKDAPILVLDEATSSLDSESESLIQDALRQLMKNKTVIVIAHRLSTIMQMDRIIVMEEGKVTDMGTHDQLLKKVGIYQKLWNIQAGGFQST